MSIPQIGFDREIMIKKIILGIIILIILVIAYNLTIQIKEATKSGERLSQSADELFKIETRNRQLKEKLTQIESQQYLEELARNKLGLSKKGETVVVIPEEKLKSILGSSFSAQIRLPNWLGWFRVFWK